MIEEEIGGIIYPLKEENLGLLKEKSKPVYIKYLSRMKGKNPTKLQRGHYILFYLSRKDKTIVGYSKINNILFKTPSEIKQEYTNRIQMNDPAFDQYTKKRKDKSLIALEIEKFTELKNVVSINYPITMAGKYITMNEVKNFIKK